MGTIRCEVVSALGHLLEGQPGRRDPLLLHRELYDDRPVPDRRGGDDSPAHFAQGYLYL